MEAFSVIDTKGYITLFKKGMWKNNRKKNIKMDRWAEHRDVSKQGKTKRQLGKSGSDWCQCGCPVLS